MEYARDHILPLPVTPKIDCACDQNGQWLWPTRTVTWSPKSPCVVSQKDCTKDSSVTTPNDYYITCSFIRTLGVVLNECFVQSSSHTTQGMLTTRLWCIVKKNAVPVTKSGLCPWPKRAIPVTKTWHARRTPKWTTRVTTNFSPCDQKMTLPVT